MFEIVGNFNRHPFGQDVFAVRNKQTGEYLHDSGESYSQCPEYWPTRELAQAVLDKYQPSHVWRHGDVFESASGVIMMFHDFLGPRKPQAMCIVGRCCGPSDSLMSSLQDAKFLFNIKDKL